MSTPVRIIKKYVNGKTYYIPQRKEKLLFLGETWVSFYISEGYTVETIYDITNYSSFLRESYAKYTVNEYMKITGEPEIIWTNEEN